VLVLTSFSDRHRITGALEAGAVGYLLEDAAAEEVVRGIRAAAEGGSPLDPRAARSLLEAAAAPDPLEGLSPREREVFGLLLEGLPNKLIARRLGISEKTVKTHLSSRSSVSSWSRWRRRRLLPRPARARTTGRR
jgi:DNA-binding NarL/FixJ family response regulator